MKLHLPTRLRKAIVATFVAVASLATTLSTGSLVGGVATLTLVAAHAASAEVVGPAASYASGALPDGVENGSNGSETAVTLSATEDTEWSFTDAKYLTFNIEAAGADVKLSGKQNSNDHDYVLASAEADSLWLALGSFRVKNDANLSSAGTIYLGGAQIQFVGTVNLDNDFVLGTSISTTSPAELGQSAFRVGHTTASGQTVTLSGDITVQEDAAISFQGNNHLKLTGDLSGSGDLAMRAYSNSASQLILAGTSDTFTGAIKSAASSITLKLGSSAVQLGGLDGSFALGLDTVTASTLTLDVAEGAEYTYTGSLASGISIVKNGAGSQSITSVITGDVVVNAGSLSLVTTDGVTSVLVKSGATVYLPSLAVGSEGIAWEQGFEYYVAASAGVDPELVTVEEGGTVVSAGGAIVAATSDQRIYADMSCLATDGSLVVEKGSVMVCDPNDLTAVSQSIASASKIVLNGGTLFSVSSVWAGEPVNYVVNADLEIKSGNGGGTLQAYGNDSTAETDSTTYTGAITGNGTLHKTDGGRVILSGDLSGFSGSFDIAGGYLQISGNTSSSRLFSGSGILEVSGTLTQGGDQTLQLNTHILSGGKIISNQKDMLDWGGQKILTIEEGGELVVNHRQTAGGVYFVLNGGTISGPGGNDAGNEYRGLDVHEGATSRVQVTADSLINTPIKLRNGASTLNAKVDAGKVLSIGNRIYGDGSLTIAPNSDASDAQGGTVSITGSGSLECATVTLAAKTTLDLNTTNSATFRSAITGDASSQITKSGSASITLSGVTNFAGTVSITGGALGFSQAATLGKLETNGGSLLIDAAAASGALTLGAAPTGTISLLVQNVGSIGDAGVRVFAEGSPMPTNVAIESAIVTDDQGSWVASYSNGVLTKTSVSTATGGDLTWKLDGASNNWGVTTAANWNKNGTAQRWVDGSSVTFAGAGESINVVSAVTATSAAITEGDYEWILGADKLTITNGVTVAQDASLTLTGVTVGDTANYQGVVTGAGTLVLKNMGMKTLDQLSNVLSSTAGQVLDTLVVAEGSALQITGGTQKAILNNITHLVVEAGGRFDNRLTNTDDATAGQHDITISGAGDASLPGKDGVSTGPAAALTFGHECGANTCTTSRKVILADDATIYVANGKNGVLTAGIDAAGNTLSIIGGGSLKLEPAGDATVSLADVAVSGASTLYIKLPTAQLGDVSLIGGSALTFYRTGNQSTADPIANNQKFTIDSLTVSESATVQGTYHASCIEIGNLAGSGTLNVVANHESSIVNSTFVSGNADFSGVVNVSHTHNSARNTVFGTADHDALSKAVVNISEVTHANSKVGFILASAGDETVQVAGISTGSGVSASQALIVSNDGVSIASDGDFRTLEIVGGGDNTFAGTVLAGVNLMMNGTGTQSFNGNMDAFDGSVEVKKGTLNLASLGSASEISLAGEGATLSVTSGVAGTDVSVAAVGAVLSADLTMAGGSLTLGTDSTRWAREGGLSLDGNKLVLDSANLGSLSVALGGADNEYSGEVVQLFTNVSSIEDANGNAIQIGAATKVGSLFAATGALADYLLIHQGTTLSLIMKGEVSNLVWNDSATDAQGGNVWKNSGANTNWLKGDAAARYTLGDNVTFAGTGETVTISGTVSPNNVTVNSGSYTWDGSGSVDASGKLSVAEGAQLTISNTGNKKFAANVEVGNNAVLSVTNLTGWSGKVSGAGNFELATGADVGSLSQFVATDKTLGSFQLSNAGTTMSVSSSDAALLNKITTLRVANGANVSVTDDATISSAVSVDSLQASSSLSVASGKTATLSSELAYFTGATLKDSGTLLLTGGAKNYSTVGSTTQANGGTLTIEAGTLKIDAASSTVGAHVLGNVAGAGTLLLANGTVTVESIADTITTKVVTEAAGDVVSVSGVAGSALDSITLVKGSQLTGVTGDITVGGTNGTTSAMTLTLDAANVGTSSTIASGKNAMIGQTGKLTINEGSVISLSIDAITTLLNQAAANAESLYLHLTTGTLDVATDVLSTLVFKNGSTSIDLLESFGVRVTGTTAGSLVLAGGANGVYAVTDDSTVNGYKELSAYQATVVASGKTLELVLDGAADDNSTAVINDLLGGTDSTLLISNTDDDSMARVELRNSLQTITDMTPAQTVGADTEFAGDIDGTAGAGDVEIVISGDGTLTVGGNVKTAQLSMNEGGLKLEGGGNVITHLVDDGVAAGSTAADSTLTVESSLTLEGEGLLTGTSIAGDGVLSLKDTLTMSDAATLDGVAVELVKDNYGTESELALDGVQDAEISALYGSGSLTAANGAEITVTGTGGSFSGSLGEIDGSTGGGTLKIDEDASQTLDRIAGSSAWSVENAGDLTINITNPAVTSGSGTNKPLTLDTLTLKSGSTTTMVINTDAPTNYLNLQELVVEDGATVALESTGLDEVDFGGSITLAYAANGVTVGDDVTVELGNSAAFKKVKEAELVASADGKSLVLQTTYHDENQYELMASSGNSAAGATLLWSVNTGALPNGSALKAVDEAVNELAKQGTTTASAQAEKILAAVAGSSTAILGSALSSDVERQLRAIRNRTTTMGVAQCEVNEGMPYVNAWINAEGDHHEMDADGFAAGYTRDSWGGTVGFDVDLTPNLTMGMAVTAMYGDIESDSADKADGDFDTQYISLFARYASSAWTHTFVATVGRADMTLDRTVNFGVGSYDTEGETEGSSFGFMYEVGRVFSLTEDGDVCLQPVANVTFRHSSVDGYEESGCDATLSVDEQTYTAVTLGVGARLQAVIGTSIYNRTSILEARALAKFDMGDRESETNVTLTHGGSTATVKSAEVGAFGAEFGVGVTVPLGSDAGSIFVDGSAEIRSGYTNINGTVGYRINF